MSRPPFARKSILCIPLSILTALTFLYMTLAGLSLTPTAEAAVITVDTPNDDLTVNGNCTLREAIQSANLDIGMDACGAGSGPDVISLPAEVYSLTLAGANEDANLTGDLDITDSLVINGAGLGVTFIDGNGLDRILHVVNTSTIGLSALTIRNGLVTGSGAGLFTNGTAVINDAQFMSNVASFSGGGLTVGGALTLTNVAVRSNTAQNRYGGGVYVTGTLTLLGGVLEKNQTPYSSNGTGGGLFAAGTAIISGTQFISNTSGLAAGGLYMLSTATLTHVVFISNTALGTHGGGLLSAGPLYLTGGSFQNNQAPKLITGQGGGLYAFNTATVNGTQFMSNTAGLNGGAIYAYQQLTLNGAVFVGNTALTAFGGGLYLGNGGNIRNVLLARNQAARNGDAIYLNSVQPTTLLHTSIVSPTLSARQGIYVLAGTLQLTNTMILSQAVGIENAGGIVNEDYTYFYGNALDLSGTVSSGTHHPTGAPAFADQTLDDYRLAQGHPAIDTGANAGVMTDFEGQARPLGSGYDIGCDEYLAFLNRLYLPLIER